jgi:serine protease Do
MKVWKKAAFAGALVAAAGAGAALAPVAHGQSKKTAIFGAMEPQSLQIWTGGSRLGVTARDVTDEDVSKHKLGTAQGVVIEDVRSDSAAEKAGFKAGDVVVEFDGERVRSLRQFTRLVQETPAGRSVAASVIRDGQKTTLKVEPLEQDAFNAGRGLEVFRDFGDRWHPAPPAPPALPARPANPPTPPRPPAPMLRDFEYFFNSRTALGITVTDLSPQLADYFGAKDGVLVSSVNEDSVAAKIGLKAGDVITSVNGTTVNDPSDVHRVMNRLSAGSEFTLEIMRERKAMTLKGKTEERQTRRGRVIL